MNFEKKVEVLDKNYSGTFWFAFYTRWKNQQFLTWIDLKCSFTYCMWKKIIFIQIFQKTHTSRNGFIAFMFSAIHRHIVATVSHTWARYRIPCPCANERRCCCRATDFCSIALPYGHALKWAEGVVAVHAFARVPTIDQELHLVARMLTRVVGAPGVAYVSVD